MSPLGFLKSHKDQKGTSSVEHHAEDSHGSGVTGLSSEPGQQSRQSSIRFADGNLPSRSSTLSSDSGIARTATASSGESAQVHSHKHKHKHGSDHAHHQSHHHGKVHAPLVPFERPDNLDPIQLSELALMAILNTPGYSPEEFERDVLPQLFHAPGYAHRVNCREVGADGLSEIVRLLRTRFAVRAREHVSPVLP